MKDKFRYILALLIAGIFYGVYSLNANHSVSYEYELENRDSVPRYPVSKTVPENYGDVTGKHPIDLRSPENIKSEVEYDPNTNTYILRTKVGDMDVSTPFTMTPQEYQDYSIKQSLQSYFREKNMELISEEGKQKTFSLFDLQFDLGPADKIFGPGGVQLKTQGSAEVKFGIKHQSTDNPALAERARKKTFFDFDEQVQLNVNAKVGDKVNFGLNYNTEATFDFDAQKIKLGYEGKEDDIIKVLEGGNVSMNTSNSLIRGGAALFGFKTELQFGKLRIGALLSQQESQSSAVSSRGGVQTTPFEFLADQYDENRHFFLAYYFRDIYDDAMSSLPFVQSGVSINRIEVWVTNKRGVFDQARNVVAFSDLGEHDEDHIYNKTKVQPTPGAPKNPSNNANNLYSQLTTNYTGARDISQVNQVLGDAGFELGTDYEKIESARRLDESDYVFNPKLGYISLKNKLQPDEILAIAFQYTYKDGKTYQVGEFSTDNPDATSESLYVKLLKGTTLSPVSPYWDLMMKNVYALPGAYSLQSEKFRFDILYQSDTTGTAVNYLTEGDIANQLLLKVMLLDSLDSRQNPYPDGFFDYVEGYTVQSQTGRIIFPVVEPFGEHLRKKINNDDIAKKYVFQELYDSTMTVAQQIAEKDKFIFRGEFKASTSCDLQLSPMLARGSVSVLSNGTVLREGVDYSVEYSTGCVTLLNEQYRGTSLTASSESQSAFGMQRKTMMGLNVTYDFNKDFTIGGTVMHLSEMPLTTKANMGEESVKNTLWGLNMNYKTQSQWLTNLVDKIPFLNLTAPSQINFNAEFAHLIPGHYVDEYNGNYSYIDDFERTKISYDLRWPSSWALSATPYLAAYEDNGGLFPEANDSKTVSYGKNRALLAWYQIDPLFTRKNSSLTPEHIKNDKDQLSNHYVREVLVQELFPNKDIVYGEETTIPVFNLAFYPKERGPYNVSTDNINPADGKFLNSEKKWGGIFRKMDQGQTDFEASNIEYIEFWLLDPFIYSPQSKGGYLYFNLGEISEDILKDGKKFAESAMPIDGDTTQLETTQWGKVPKRQTLNYAFNAEKDTDRKLQDVGLNGLQTKDEFDHDTYKKFLENLRAILSDNVKFQMEQDPFSPFNDPASDNYHYYRGSDYDQEQKSILARYKKYNGLEGNSTVDKDSPESYSTAAKMTPDVEDINQDYTLNENEKYFEYGMHLTPDSLVAGKVKYLTNIHKATVRLRNGNDDEVTWYQFKIPVKSPDRSPGKMKDFRSIRFMRMYMTGFQDSVIMRFATLELVKGDWRIYQQALYRPDQIPSTNGNINIASVNIEENGDKEPVNYVLPPGVSRALDPGQAQIIQQNEQALSMVVTNLAQGDARAVYKNTNLDMRQYKRIQMFAHAEKLIGDVTNLQNNEISVFMRLGSDYKNNYYEYEIPLKLTPPGVYSTYNSTDQRTVWPEENMFDFPFEILTKLKLERNRVKRQAGSSVTFITPYTSYDPDKPLNKITVVGNPSISEVKTIMIGVRNNAHGPKSTEVWVNELRLTDFDEDGGWAANANLNIGLSDFGSVNLAGRVETVGFGGLDQNVMQRNMDDFYQYSVATNVELGKFFPENKVSAPMYYSYAKEIVNPKYNPLDQDILLSEALDAVDTSQERDSIKSYAQDKIITKNFNLSSVKVNVSSKNPMPYDPSNFTFAYSYSGMDKFNPETEYERTKDYRGSINYSYTPYAKPYQPFKDIKSKSGTTKYARELSIGYLPSNISFMTNMYRNYYETQLRDLNNLTGKNNIPVSFRQEFYWERSFALTWNLTKNLNFSLKTGTNAMIEEPHDYPVNKQLYPDAYEVWKDSVWKSIKSLGTPMNYDQNFTATYNVPLNLIPVLDWTTLSATYNALYNWDKGATVTNMEIGNTIKNQRQMDFNGGLTMTTLYNKSKFLRDVNKKFVLKKPPATPPASQRRTGSTPQVPKKPATPEKKAFEKEIQLNRDSFTLVTHNLKTKKLRISARREDGRRYPIEFKAINENTIRINNKDSVALKLSLLPGPKPEETTWFKVAQIAARGIMMVRSVNATYNITNGMMLPGFRPDIGDAFGQGSANMGYAPGLDFAFGFTDENYIKKADERGWLIKNTDNVNPAMYNSTENFTLRAILEPFVGMKIDLSASRMYTKTSSIQFMYGASGQYPTQYGGTFNMTTIALASSLRSPNVKNGYQSDAFDKFLQNRNILTNRLQSQYANTQYPTTGFFNGSTYSGNYNPAYGTVSQNSGDVLIPAFIAAYTGKDANSISTSPFPSLLSLLPNWRVTYEGLIQLGFINKHFKSFLLNHQYKCNYTVGSFSSFMSWVGTGTNDLGFVEGLSGNPIPSSPYDISLVSITESFSPLIGLDATFKNNMSVKAEIRNTRNVNLNVASYQVVETYTDEIVFGLGYKLTEFNKVLKLKHTGAKGFSNDLIIRADISYRKMQALIRKIEDGFTQATNGAATTTIKMSAAYNMTKMLTLKAFYDRDVNRPLISSNSFPTSNSNFGLSVTLNLTR